ncbi:serine/threonine-protein kinase [Sphaerisporangium sp. TRM90804]|uniref:serine/threonine-protein kinase n=1 Tax=Sphaerisporangium sp. TRM90804 TaxID=3031113 RepID=UPI00244831FD|nr:serine/threonine-protein kinase [Sphaerisporangium sp. TRM90804]MDH2430665.1 serine/threonine-protein kinase [Sphaerisporangium sp. TRM90804]
MRSDHAQQLGDRYRLISPLGQGGMGIVWRAHDRRLARDVAIKELRPTRHDDEHEVRRARRHALREARSAARLSHPAIVTVHDLLEEDGRLWIVMELVEALTLQATAWHLGRLPVHWTAWIGFHLLGGLRHAHAAGVLHRDIKPGNVLLTGDRVVLSDFGIAVLQDDDTSHQTNTMPIVGSPGYIAPERLRGHPATQAADLWSFGATLYFSVEGRPPGSGDGDLLTARPPGEARPPRRAGALRALLEGLLRPDPVDRLSSDQAVLLLSEILRKEGIAVPPMRLTGDEMLPPGAFTM